MESLNFLIKSAINIEKIRVACQVRLSHLAKQNRFDTDTKTVFEKCKDLEDYIDSKCAGFVEIHPASWWFLNVKGVGKENIGKVLGLLDIQKANHISSFWKFMGFYPDGKLKKGEKSPFCRVGKSMSWRMGTSLLRAKGKFYDYYLKQKEQLTKKYQNQGIKIKPTPTSKKDKNGIKIKKQETKNVIWEGHLHNQAFRKMIKMFLAMLWLAWREAVNLPISEPYSKAKLGHNHIFKPRDFMDK